jgi:4-hydroxy-tetrahydrodipicolinate reductase
MGQCLVKAAVLSEQAQLTVAVCRPASSALGHDVGALAGIGALGVEITGDLAAAMAEIELMSEGVQL